MPYIFFFEGKFEYFNRKFSENISHNAGGMQIVLTSVCLLLSLHESSRHFIEERIKKIAQGEPVEPHYDFIALTMDRRKIVVKK